MKHFILYLNMSQNLMNKNNDDQKFLLSCTHWNVLAMLKIFITWAFIAYSGLNMFLFML